MKTAGKGIPAARQQLRRKQALGLGILSLLGFVAGMGFAALSQPEGGSPAAAPEPEVPRFTAHGWPLLDPLPQPDEIWECELVVVGGSLGGVAAAGQAMRGGVQTCLIELTPWLGGQITSQGVSAIDESLPMRQRGNFSRHWLEFKALIESQPVHLPAWTGIPPGTRVSEINSCWVGGAVFSAPGWFAGGGNLAATGRPQRPPQSLGHPDRF